MQLNVNRQSGGGIKGRYDRCSILVFVEMGRKAMSITTAISIDSILKSLEANHETSGRGVGCIIAASDN